MFAVPGRGVKNDDWPEGVGASKLIGVRVAPVFVDTGENGVIGDETPIGASFIMIRVDGAAEDGVWSFG